MTAPPAVCAQRLPVLVLRAASRFLLIALQTHQFIAGFFRGHRREIPPPPIPISPLQSLPYLRLAASGSEARPLAAITPQLRSLPGSAPYLALTLQLYRFRTPRYKLC